MNVGNRMQDLRKERGLNQDDVAAALGVSTGTISNWERGSRKPDLAQLNKLADYFSVSADYLLGRTNERDAEAKHFHSPKNSDLWRRFADLFEPGSIDYIEFAIEMKERDIDPEEVREFLKLILKLRKQDKE